MTPVERTLERLDGVRHSGAGRWTCRCPAHQDRSSSLSVREAEDGRVLIHCFAGCDTRAVLNAVGLELRDLFTPREHRPGRFPASTQLRRPALPVPDARRSPHAWLWRDLSDDALRAIEAAPDLPDIPPALLSLARGHKAAYTPLWNVESHQSPEGCLALEALADWLAECLREIMPASTRRVGGVL